jgi:hypothetical protein
MPSSCNLGTLSSWNPLGHSRPVTGLFTFLEARVLYCTTGFTFDLSCFLVCFTAVAVRRCHTARNWLMINWKAVYRKRSWLNRSTMPTFSWGDSVKPPNPRTTKDPSQIRTKLAALPLCQYISSSIYSNQPNMRKACKWQNTSLGVRDTL